MEEENSPKTSFLDAVEKGDKELVNLLLQERKQKIDLNFKYKDKVFSFSFSFSLLLLFSFSFSFSSLLFLSFSFFFFLKKLLFVQDRKTVLHLAAEHGFEEIVKVLLEHGSDVDLQDKVFSFFSLSLFLSFLFDFFMIGVVC